MEPYFETSQISLYQGDCLAVMRSLPSESIDCCVTSPPYWGLRDYKTPPQLWGGNPDCDHEWSDWREVRDIREATSHGKTRTTDRFYGNPSRKFNGNHQKHFAGSSCSSCGAWLGEFGQEPTLQAYVDHLVEIFAQIHRVLKLTGTAWLNLGDSFANDEKQSGLKPKDLCMIPHRCAIALQDFGWWVRSDVVWAKGNPMPESVQDRPTRSHEYIFLLSKSSCYHYDAEAIREPAQDWGARPNRDEGKSRRIPGQSPHTGLIDGDFSQRGRNKRSVWRINTTPYPDAHFAVFPPELARICISASCPQDGVVLDPFVGSGTAAFVAKELGRKAIGIDLSSEYLALAADRCSQLTIFTPQEATA